MPTLILSCSTGQGHNSCAKAIKEYYDHQGEKCFLKDPLDYVSHKLSRFVCWGHTAMYRKCHWLFKLGYGYSEKHESVFDENSSAYVSLSKGAESIYSFIRDEGIDKVICTHIFASILMTVVGRKYPLQAAVCSVATDYTATPGTSDCVDDIRFIPDVSLAREFVNPELEGMRVIASGIPVRQMFYRRKSADEAKQIFKIVPSHKHILMMCGSMGCGPMKKLTKELVRRTGENVEVSIVCGTNHTLRRKLRKKYSKNAKVHVLGYVEDMSTLMDSADLCLTNPGGISVTEAAVKSLPMVFINAVAGCEDHNRRFFIERGCAKTADSVPELVDVCIGLLELPAELSKMRRSFTSLHTENAAATIYVNMKKTAELKASVSESHVC